MSDPIQLLIVDDDVGFVHAAAEIAREQGFEITVAGSLSQARTRLRDQTFDIALLDITLPDGCGLDLLNQIDLGGTTQVILITGHPTVESALKAMRLPIVDYVVKPLYALRFVDLLTTAAKRRRALAPSDPQWHGLAGVSPAMTELRQQICRVAPTDVSVFIEGESGVGKELVASAIHAESGRPGPFVALNCGAVPAELLTSQLFGHERGSFTGANARHVGLFEQAQGGTLFLDEISEMPIHLQVHLLRALETRTIRRVGGSEDLPVDVRIISATNRPPASAVEASLLREDLFYRLSEFPLQVPPLRNRMEDVVPIANLFLDRLNSRYGTQRTLSCEGAEQLERYPWPGNVRELRNVIQRSYILADSDVVTPVLPAGGNRPVVETDSTILFAVGTPLHEVERRMLFKTLAYFGNNKAKAAQALGVTTKTIYNRLTAYEASDRKSGNGDEPSGDDNVPGDFKAGHAGPARIHG